MNELWVLASIRWVVLGAMTSIAVAMTILLLIMIARVILDFCHRPGDKS